MKVHQSHSSTHNRTTQGEAGANATSFQARTIPLQLATTINHGSATTIANPTNLSETLKVGTWMSAHLDPNDNQSGSKVSPNLSGPLQNLTLGSKRRYVQGHLLNSRVGGEGNDPVNLTPLSYSANGNHFQKVEKEVINLVKGGNTVDYTVVPDYSGTPRGPVFGIENDIERNFASSLNCTVVENGKTHKIPITNVPPYP
jgi:hypothetical protein